MKIQVDQRFFKWPVSVYIYICIYTVSVYLYKHKHISYHHRKDYGSSGSFDDPEKQQAAELDNGEHVNLS